MNPPIDPDNPSLTELQKSMLNGLETLGYIGVIQAIREYIDKIPVTNASGVRSFNATANQKLLDDFNGDNHAMRLLGQVPIYVLRHIIRSDLPYAIANDARVARWVQNNMTRAADTSGVYLMYFAEREADSKCKKRASAGRFLSADGVGRLCSEMEEYVGVRTARSNAKAKLLDNKFPPKSQEEKNHARAEAKRRWAMTTRAEKNLREFCKVQREMNITGETGKSTSVHPSKAGIGSRRSPAEVGISIEIGRRLREHMNVTFTTYPFGFIRSWISLHHGDTFHIPRQYTLFRLWKQDQQLGAVAEILGTYVAAAYIEHGGMNPSYAGSWAMPNPTSVTKARFDAHASSLFDINTLRLPDADVFHRLDQDYDRAMLILDQPDTKLAQAKREAAAALEERQRMEQVLQDTSTEQDDLKAELVRLKQEFASKQNSPTGRDQCEKQIEVLRSQIEQQQRAHKFKQDDDEVKERLLGAIDEVIQANPGWTSVQLKDDETATDESYTLVRYVPDTDDEEDTSLDDDSDNADRSLISASGGPDDTVFGDVEEIDNDAFLAEDECVEISRDELVTMIEKCLAFDLEA